MKRLSNYIIILSIIGMAFSCNDPDEPEITANATQGGLLTVSTPLINYVVGDGATYSITVIPYQSPDVRTTSIDVRAVFQTIERATDGTLVYRNADGDIVADATLGSTTTVTSNEVSIGTISPDDINSSVSLDVVYADLVDGFTVSGTSYNSGSIPANDGDLIIGDVWNITFVSTTSSGQTLTNAAGASISVATRYAGTYNVIDKDYFRIGVDRSDLDSQWPATQDIKSIDAVTYEQLEYIGLFDGNQLFFQIDPTTLAITYPAEWAGVAQILNDQPITTCEANPGDLTNVPCATSNEARPDADGKDILDMTVGYFTAGSGPREFWTLLQKP